MGILFSCSFAIGLLCLAPLDGPYTGEAVATSSVRAALMMEPTSSTHAGNSQASPQNSFSLAPPVAKHKGRRRIITGTVVETHDYCGGVNPPDEVLEALRKETPVANKLLYVRSGSTNAAKPAVLEFTTDARGNFKISLPAGDYCIIEESKKDRSQMPDLAKLNEKLSKAEQYQLSSPDCLEKWWGTCDYSLNVGPKNLRDVVIKFHRTCNPPCMVGGPMPA